MLPLPPYVSENIDKMPIATFYRPLLQPHKLMAHIGRMSRSLKLAIVQLAIDHAIGTTVTAIG